MKDPSISWTRRTGVASIFLVPLLHPLLMPLVGVPSHLLWWVHVLPVALFTFWFGQRAAVVAMLASAGLVAVGEMVLGGGYGVPASTETVVALTAALTLTNLLVVAFAVHARRVSHEYRLLFDNVGMGVLRLDAEGRIAGLNPAAREMLAPPTAAPPEGRLLSDVLCTGGALTAGELESRGGWTGQIEVQSETGPRTMHAVLALARDLDGHAQVLIADRSTEVMHEQEIERQAKLASLGEALAGVAHELNNPLTAILAHAQLGAMQEDEEDSGELFEVIEHESVRMRDIVGELLGFSRRSETEECANLDHVLDRMVRVQRIALGKMVRIDTDLDWPHPVHASGLKIEQILLNLMSNAAYAVRSSRGGSISVSSRREGSFIEVEVRDEGTGIAPEILDRLFEPFATTKPEGEGTGLGLAISRRLARGWGGDLTARNVEPRGAAFTLRLRTPAAEADAPGLEPLPEQRIA